MNNNNFNQNNIGNNNLQMNNTGFNQNQMPPRPEENNMIPNMNNGQVPPVQNYNVGQNQSQNKKPLYIIIAALVVVIIIVVLMLVLNKKDDENDIYTDYEKELEKQKQAEEKEEEELNKNYSIKDYVLKDGDILIEFENKNNKVVDVEFKIEYYDENNNVIDTDKSYIFSVIANGKSYVNTYVSDEISYKTYKIITKVSKSYSYKLYNNEVSIINSNIVNNNIIIQAKNNSNVKLDRLKVSVLYYDNENNIIGYSMASESDIASGETTSLKTYLPYDSNYKRIEYSRYNINIDAAYVD